MFSKMTVGGVFALALIALLVQFGGQLKAKKIDPNLKKPMLEEQRVGEVTAIELKQGDKTLKLLRGADDIWRIGDLKDGKLADAKRIVRFLDELSRSQFEQVVGRVQDSQTEFGLSSPTLISLEAGGEVLTRVNLGGERRGGGQYVSIAGEEMVYLTGSPLRASPEDKSWEAPEAPLSPSVNAAEVGEKKPQVP